MAVMTEAVQIVARSVAGFGAAATLVSATLIATAPTADASSTAANASTVCPAAQARADTTSAARTSVEPECDDIIFSSTYYSLQSCDEGGQQIQDENSDVTTWYCVPNSASKWTLHVIVCKWVNGVEEAETWIDVNSGMYLDVTNQSTANGAAVHQWTYSGADNQWWLRVLTPEGYYRVVNVNSGKCLGVSGASLGNGAQIVQWDCNDSYDQQWSYSYAGTLPSGWPVYNLVDRNSGKCLGIIGGSTDTGGNAVQWTCNGSRDQEWY